jgi:hypothetical protein
MIYVIREAKRDYIIGIFYSKKQYKSLQAEYYNWLRRTKKAILHLDDFVKEYDLEELPMQSIDICDIKHNIRMIKLPTYEELLEKYFE